MKRWKALLGGLAAIGLGLAAIGGASASRATAPLAFVQPGLVSSTILPDGSVQELFTNGATFVGTAGTTISFATLSNGTNGGGYQMSATPPDSDTGGLAAMAHAFSASLLATAACGSLTSSGALSINDQIIHEYGAFRRYKTCDSDPNYHYTYEESQLSGQGKHNIKIVNMGTEHYYLHGSIIKWAPGGNMTTGSSCSSQTVGLTAFGVSVSETIPVCPDRIRPSVPTKDFKVQWEGCTNDGSTKAAANNSSDKVPNGVSAGFTYVLYYNWNIC